jgi:BirA family biotin operon repressor/biotin-[acetyl-CoA-carboxylase] ligase
VNADKLQESLQTRRLGRTILFSREVSSTNDWGKELASLGATEGTVVVAETQTVGHGRLGRKWVSPRGGLWFSAILRPEKLRPTEAVKLVFVAGLAVAEVLHELYDLPVETKWPNDVLINGRKVCGILAEMNTQSRRVNYVVVGVGVNANFDLENVFQDSLRKTATSLKRELGRRVPMDELFKALLEKFEYFYELFLKQGFILILDRWKKYACFLGHQVEVSNQDEKISGLACDVDVDGSLVLKPEDGKIMHVLVGDVSKLGT